MTYNTIKHLKKVNLRVVTRVALSYPKSYKLPNRRIYMQYTKCLGRKSIPMRNSGDLERLPVCVSSSSDMEIDTLRIQVEGVFIDIFGIPMCGLFCEHDSPLHAYLFMRYVSHVCLP